MTNRNPSRDPFFEYEPTSNTIIRPVEEEIWQLIRLLGIEDFCIGQLKQRRSAAGRRRPLEGIASDIRSCITQAEEYFGLALNASPRTAPLLHYYSMLNLTKALVYLEAPEKLETKRHFLHGLTDPHRIKHPGRFSLDEESVLVVDGVFRSLYYVLTRSEIARRTELPIMQLLRYSVYVNSEIEDLGRVCRLVGADISIVTDTDARRVGLAAEISRADLRRHCGNRANFEREAPSFRGLFRPVRSDNVNTLRYESDSIPYTNAATHRNAIRELRRRTRDLRLYRQMGNSDDGPSAEHIIPLTLEGRTPLPEPCVLFAITFYLSSLVRYQPHIYDYLLGTEEAWLLESFVRQCPIVFCYVMLNHLWRNDNLFHRQS